MEIVDTQNAEQEDASARRRMPDNLRKYLLQMQGGKLYLPAAYRLVWFRDEHPDWGIDTAVVEGGEEAGFVTFRAYITDPTGRVISTGHKTETRKDFPAGFCEKAETGAVARALAMAGFGTQFSRDLDEGRLSDSPVPAPQRRPAPAPSPAPPAVPPSPYNAKEFRRIAVQTGLGEEVATAEGMEHFIASLDPSQAGRSYKEILPVEWERLIRRLEDPFGPDDPLGEDEQASIDRVRQKAERKYGKVEAA